VGTVRRLARGKRAVLNIYVSGLIHAPDHVSGYVKLTYCFAFLNDTTRYVRLPVTCVQCLAVRQAMGPGDDPYDARRRLGDKSNSLWGPLRFP
jgi:hypothetical protein